MKKIRASFVTWFLKSEVTFDLDRRCHTKYGSVCTWQVTWLDSLLLLFFLSFFELFYLRVRLLTILYTFFFWYIKTVLRTIRALAQLRIAYSVSVEYDRSLLHAIFSLRLYLLGFAKRRKKMRNNKSKEAKIKTKTLMHIDTVYIRSIHRSTSAHNYRNPTRENTKPKGKLWPSAYVMRHALRWIQYAHIFTWFVPPDGSHTAHMRQRLQFTVCTSSTLVIYLVYQSIV